jgi:ribosomal protein S18 acetylase RimI-like enzyme
VLSIMRQAFSEYVGKLDPPSGTHRETVGDVQEAMRRGGAVIAWQRDIPVGSARFELQSHDLYVSRVAVLPQYRRQGVASAIIGWLEEYASNNGLRQVRVAVRMSLPLNVEFFRALGYSLTKVSPHPKGPDHIGTLQRIVSECRPDPPSPRC